MLVVKTMAVWRMGCHWAFEGRRHPDWVRKVRPARTSEQEVRKAGLRQWGWACLPEIVF